MHAKSQDPQAKRSIRVAGIVDDSTVDGPGVRYTIFMQGCAHNCSGCHNPATHDYLGGGDVTFDQILDDLRQYKYIKSVTFSGGEPLDQSEPLAALISDLKKRGYHVLIFTGYTYEAVLKSPERLAAVKQADILIDGPFILSKRTLTVPFRGSFNQRMIDVQASLSSGEVVEISEEL